jgi:hypothetical protein
MKTTVFIAILTLVLGTSAMAQTKFPVNFRVEKLALSTPMTTLEEVFFNNYFIAKPVNVKFDGTVLNLCYDNGSTLAKTNVTEVNRSKSFEDDALTQETIFYTNDTNVSDTISLVIDHAVGYLQLVVPSKNSKGESVGYTSYRKFINKEELALN